MTNLPSGTVTFLFTDIEGSTRLAQEYPDTWGALSQQHDAVLQAAVAAHNGYIFKTVGDAFCVAFASPSDALLSALQAQRNLQTSITDPQIRVRMGLHTGEAEILANGDYQGYLALSRVQRLMSAGHGGQVLLSQAAQELVRDGLPQNITLRDLGERRLRDLIRPEHIYQVVIQGLPTEFPGLRTLDAYRHNLPAQTTSFIGREKEISEVKDAVQKHRLVTLTGSGGTGKTRLSLQVAAELLDAFPDGIWLVELASLADPELIPQTILAVLNLPEPKNRSALQALEDHLLTQTALIVLDNCEHLIMAASQVVMVLLQAAPNLKILASSREALGVPGELVWHVPSLTTPDPKKLPEIDQLSQYEAVRLFIDRAILANPHFEVNKDNAPAIAQICHRLDGIPLALELAAARMKMLSVDEISARLDDRFRLLTGGARTALPRQQTLRAMIDWSYDLLSEDERLLLRRLAVFVGGWRLGVAEQVCADERIDRYEILDLLGRLVDKSLVAAAESKSATRYRILETVRQYAREKLLESGEGEAIRDRHVSAYLELVEEAEPKIRSADQPLWLDRLEEEIDNLRAALEWSREREAENCLRLASALWRFCDIRGYWREAIDWLTQTLSATESLKTLSRARALARTAHLMSNRQNWDAEPLAEEAYRLGSELGDQSSIARALFVLGSIEIQRYHGQRGTDLLKQSLELARNIGDHGLAAALLLKLGWQARDTDLQSSTSLMNQGIEEARRSGDGRVICYGLVNYIDNLLVQGRIEEARNLARESHQLAETIGDYNHMVYSQVALADIGLFLEDYGLAEEYANQALDLARSRSDEIELSGPMFDLALVALARGEVEKVSAYGQQLVRLGEKSLIRTMLVTGKWVIGRAEILTGDFAAAERYLKEALVVAREDNFLPGICFFLEEFAVLAIAQDQHTRGVVLLGARERLRESVFIVEFPISVRQRDEYASRAREQLSEQALDEAWQRGRALSVDEAVAYAFETAHG